MGSLGNNFTVSLDFLFDLPVFSCNLYDCLTTCAGCPIGRTFHNMFVDLGNYLGEYNIIDNKTDGWSFKSNSFPLNYVMVYF